jgi:hypothetical protein
MHTLDTWGVIEEGQNIAPDLKAEMVGQRSTQIIEKSNNSTLPLFHPGEDDDVNTEYRLLGYCLLQLFIKRKSRQENKERKIGSEVI